MAHPDSDGGEFSLATKLTRFGVDVLKCEFILLGPLDQLVLPDIDLPQREDELWKTTCFELFLKYPESTAYREWNFAPTGKYASYWFEDYRSGMMPMLYDRMDIWPERTGNVRYRLNAYIQCSDIPTLLEGQVGLSTILEHRDGSMSYWAVSHPEGKPDFHHSDCFGTNLGAPSRA
ncbi:DOMON-like domain-containing protein [Erythrobacter aureus]|uniref:DOMON-like domain-containing protein n=1 Tax=Erythrobacter aureus TaxID=2182384 RepID=UPI003A918EF5